MFHGHVSRKRAVLARLTASHSHLCARVCNQLQTPAHQGPAAPTRVPLTSRGRGTVRFQERGPQQGAMLPPCVDARAKRSENARISLRDAQTRGWYRGASRPRLSVCRTAREFQDTSASQPGLGGARVSLAADGAGARIGARCKACAQPQPQPNGPRGLTSVHEGLGPRLREPSVISHVRSTRRTTPCI